MAQKGDSKGLAPVGIFTGQETAPGTVEPSSGMLYGNTFVLNSYGEWETHHLTISADYSINQFVPDTYGVTGGSWSLVVFRDGKYAGTLYGTVSGGNVLLITNSNGDPCKQTRIDLISTGGLGVFAGKEGEGIAGVHEAFTNVRSGETSGNTSFTF